MKKFAVALSIIILLAMLLSRFPILAQPTHTPHEDPAFARSSPSPTSLLTFYGNVYNLAASEYYRDAMSTLNEIENANIPEDPRDLIDLYNTFSQKLFTTLDDLELLLEEIGILIRDCLGCGTEQRIAEAQVTIDEAELLLDDIKKMTDTLGDKLGVFIAASGDPIKHAYDRLLEAIDRLGELIDETDYYHKTLINIYEVQAAHLMPIEISLSVTPDTVFVGDNITASGRLTSSGIPLANRKLTIFLDDEPLDITTDVDGSYTANITVPYKYVTFMTLKTLYIPSGNDIDIYQHCESLPVEINTRFYPTFLEVVAPETGYPGLPITISGQVSSTYGTIDRTVRVLLGNTELAEEITQGQFNIEITLPQQVSTGKHRLTVIVNPQGRYADVSKNLTINISKIPLQVEIKRPLLVFFNKPIEVSGEVRHSLGPLQDARVMLTFMDSSTTVKTSTYGSFIATLEVSPGLSFVGAQELEIAIEPVEPWYSSLKITRKIFTINPANIGLTLVAVAFLGLVVFRRVRTRTPRRREKMVIPEAGLREPLIVAPTPVPEYRFGDIKDRILSSYRKTFRIVEEVIGIPMASNTTLREFLDATTPQLPTAMKPFTALTLLAEDALYSAHRLDESIAAKAEQLAAIIKEELYGGAA